MNKRKNERMKTDHAGGMSKRDVLRVRTFGPVSAHSRACDCALSGLRVRTLRRERI